MSYLPPDLVKLGFWIDQSRGAVLGSIITTTTKTGNILVALAAVLITLASAHLWNLLLFGFYHLRADRAQADGLFRQQQVLIRSLSTPDSTLVEFGKLGWYWRGRAAKSSIRCFVPAIVAFVFLVISLAAGIFSSLIVSTTNLEVLVDSQACGYANPQKAGEVQTYLAESTIAIQTYTRSCYSDAVSSASCNTYVRPRMHFSKTESSCPFSNQMCVGHEFPAVTFDTGLLDSNDDFGINVRAEDRAKFRMKSTCAPIRVPGFYTTTNATLFGVQHATGYSSLVHQPKYVFNYGPLTYQNETLLVESIVLNATTTYTAAGLWSYRNYPDQSPYHPIPELAVDNADTDLVFVFSNNVQSFTPIDDPVFSAHRPSRYSCQDCERKSHRTYVADYPAGVVGCANQYQFCAQNPLTGLQCTDLGGLPLSGVKSSFPRSPGIQLATLELFVQAAKSQDFSNIGRSSPPHLKALTTLNQQIQHKPLGPDYWKEEVTSWMELVLVGIQKMITDHAIGPTLNNGTSLSKQPEATGEEQLCKAQKMTVSGGFANISVFGLALSVAVSMVIILADIGILKFAIFLNRFRTVKTDRWIQDGVLQLQRKAYQAQGEGSWSREKEEIPMTDKGEMLSDLPLQVPKSTSRAGITWSVSVTGSSK